jgi:hypothetical protein
MQTIVAHFEDPQETSQASAFLRTPATKLTDRQIRNIFPNVSEEDFGLYPGAVFTIMVPMSDAKKRLTTNIFRPTGEGSEEFGFNKVFYKEMPNYAAAAAGRKTRRFKKKRLMSRKYCKKTSCKKMGFTQKASCRPYKNCYI